MTANLSVAKATSRSPTLHSQLLEYVRLINHELRCYNLDMLSGKPQKQDKLCQPQIKKIALDDHVCTSMIFFSVGKSPVTTPDRFRTASIIREMLVKLLNICPFLQLNRAYFNSYPWLSLYSTRWKDCQRDRAHDPSWRRTKHTRTPNRMRASDKH